MLFKRLSRQPFIKNLLHTPNFIDEEQAELARLLIVFSWLNIVIFTVSMLTAVIASPSQFLRPLAILGFVIVIFSLVLMLVKRGRVRQASYLVIGLLWLLVTLLSISAGGVDAPSYAGYFVVTFLAGILMGGQAVYVMAGICGLSGLVMVYLSNIGLLPTPMYQHSNLTQWIGALIFTLILAILQNYTSQQAKKSLWQAKEDLNERKRAEQALRNNEDQLQRKTRALLVLSNCNQALVRTSDETELLQELCRICVTDGNYRLAWVGYAEDNPEQSVYPVAEFGFEDDYLASVNITWADNERGRGPTGTAIRTGQPVIARDILVDPQFAPWREAALKRGYASSIALPLNLNGKVSGAFMLYSHEPNAFEVDEIALLVELSKDMAYGIQAVRTRKEQLQLQKELENRVRERTAQVQDLYDNAPVGYHSLDGNGCFVTINQTELNWLGYTREELLGRPLTAVFTPEGVAKFKANFDQFKKSGSMRNLDFEVVRKDGTTFPILIDASAIYGMDGQYISSRSIMTDVTERKRAEAALQESEQRMELAFRAAQDGIWDWNIETDEVFYSSRYKAMLGYENNELEPHVSAWQRLLHPDDLAQATQVVQAVLRGEREYIMEFRMKHKDGHYVDILSRGIPIRRELHGPIVRIVGTHFDLTERKRIEKALKDANSELEYAMRVKDEFLANMSHELRTPLSGILGMSEILLLGYRGALNERQHQFVTTIDSSAHHLLNLINDILDLAKLDADKLELKFETLSVKDICQSSLSFVKELANKKGVALELALDPEAQLIQGDARRLKQILVNLLSNAVKFTATNGKVTLATHLAPNHQTLAFSVSDTGIGIAPADLARLFTPFTQVDNSLTRAYEGTGLGLSLVKRLVELHGGNISVESSVGHGSHFTVSLPWQAATSPVLPESNSSVKSPPQPVVDGKNLATILLVEDNAANTMFIGDYLDSLGYSMVYAYDGLAGLAKAVECVPQLILMDIQMPKLDGFETMRRLRADPQFAHTPIIALTASAMKGDAERCLQAGATDYLSKPVRLQELSEKIKRLLDG